MNYWSTGLRLAFLLAWGGLLAGAAPCLAQESRVWVTHAESLPGPSARIETPIPRGSMPFGEPFVFEPIVICDDSFDEVAVTLSVSDTAGNVLYTGALTRLLYVGENPSRFVWTPETLPDGDYVARIRAKHPFIAHIAEERLYLQKISWGPLAALLDRAESASEQAAADVAHAEEQGAAASWQRAKAAIAVDTAALARAVAEEGRWPLGLYLAGHAEHAAGELSAHLASTGPAERYEAVPAAEPGAVRVGKGGLRADGRPVFLIGGYLDHPTPEAVAALERYGLGFASIAIPPGTLEDNDAALDAFFQSAARHNVAVAVSASALELSPDAFREQPEALVERDGGEHVDTMSEPARRVVGSHMAAVAERVEGRDAVAALSVATSPEFFFHGEAVRLAFSDLMRDVYESRLHLNRMWRSNLRSFDDIDIWRDYVHLSYQYDWQTFHQALGARYLDSILDIALSRAPGLPATVTFSDAMLLPGESRYGVNYEKAAAALDLLSVATGAPEAETALAMPFPHASAVYSLLRSLNADVPLINLRRELYVPGLYDFVDRRAYVRSVIWEDVMAGANAVAVSPWPGAWDDAHAPPLGLDPESLEGMASAAYDLNRLAPIVEALQREPARVAIVWSLPSKIHNDGADYLQAVRDAFEGCSFGGRKVGFITEAQIEAGGLDNVEVLVLPRLTATTEKAFEAIEAYIAEGGAVIRTADPIPFTERGQYLQDLLSSGENVVLVRGGDAAAQYLHATAAMDERVQLSPVVHVRNAFGYPLEGLRTAYAEHEGVGYLYLLNMRHDPVEACLSHGIVSGHDLVQARDLSFPAAIQPLTPMLIRLDGLPAPAEAPLAPAPHTPTAVVAPVSQEAPPRPAPRTSPARPRR